MASDFLEAHGSLNGNWRLERRNEVLRPSDEVSIPWTENYNAKGL